MELDLKKIRDELDVIDKQILDLFEKRNLLCGDVAEYKISVGKPVLDKEREKEKLQVLCASATDAFNKEGINELFSQIMAISRKLQYKKMQERGKGETLPFQMVDSLKMDNIRVVYQGVQGAYSNAATVQFFGENVDCYYVRQWEDAMKEVAEGRADYAVLPIENSKAGQVGDVYDLLDSYNNTIVGECYLPVSHCLLGLPGAKKEEIKTVYSHIQALMQCKGYLANYPDWERIEKDNTAASARMVLEYKDRTKAAIASEMAAKLYGLEILDYTINDQKNNTTRFIVVSKSKIYCKNAKKISLCFELPHESGSLYHILSHFIFNQVNMTKIESRPIADRAWEYRFFVDIEGNLEDPGVKNALYGIEQEALILKILGNY
ncbi:MAG: prephenate dehydratase [Lachnospiraceae bacterium]